MIFDEVFDAWLDRHKDNGFAVSSFLNPPATSEALDAAETRIGFTLPDDIRRLWQRANGQQDIYDVVDPAPGRVLCPLFGEYTFLSLEDALEAYRMWLGVWDGGGPGFDDDFNGENHVKRRGNDPVYREYWRPGWLPFADDNGNAYAADLAPAPGGTVGQIIVIGPDEGTRRVLASSITAFLADASANCPVFVRSRGDDGHLWYFDLEEALADRAKGPGEDSQAESRCSPANGTKTDPAEPRIDADERAVDFVIEVADLIHAQRLVLRRNLTRPRAIIALAALTLAFFAGSVALILFTDGRVMASDAALFGVVPLIGIASTAALVWVLVPLRVRRTLRESPVLRRPTRRIWSETGLTGSSVYGQGTVPWEDLHSWVEDRHVFVIHETRGTIHVVPKRVLSEAQAGDLRGCLGRIERKPKAA